MPDLDDYLYTGVMSGNPFGLDIPLEAFELEIAALDIADEIIDSYRRLDRSFDAACDVRARAWTWWAARYEDLGPGHVVTVRVGKGYNSRPVHGRIKSVGPYGVEMEQGHGFRESDWEGGGRLLVPIPFDLSTLGKYHGDSAIAPDASST